MAAKTETHSFKSGRQIVKKHVAPKNFDAQGKNRQIACNAEIDTNAAHLSLRVKKHLDG